MAANIDLTSQKWLDLIFEGRNHSYGAYVLRQQSSKRHLIAFVFSMVFVAVIVFTAITVKEVNDTITRNRVIENVVLGDFDLTPPPPPEELTKPDFVAPPPVELAKTIGFVIPEIKEDILVREEDEFKAQDEILANPTAIVSTIDNLQGRDDGLGIDPKDLADNKVIVQDDTPVTPEVFDIVEIKPDFPGGESAMYEWLAKNINYPVIAQENNIQGKVTLQFVVGKNGEIENIVVMRGVDPSLDKEAVRVVKAMPNWIPGKQGGVPVKVRFTLPVQFKLQ